MTNLHPRCCKAFAQGNQNFSTTVMTKFVCKQNERSNLGPTVMYLGKIAWLLAHGRERAKNAVNAQCQK